jgi:predicted acyl esterase
MRLLTILIVLFLLGGPDGSAVAQIWQEVTIPMTDGVDLDATIVTPLGFPPSGGFPTLILIHGLGSDKETMYPVAIAMAAYGYASLCYTVRGHGNSGGLCTLDGPRETQDLREVISYLRSLPFVNRNNLAVIGGSQGGIHGWAAAVHRMPGVRTVIPMLATPDFARALMPNGCVSFGLPREMRIGSVRYDPVRDRVRDLIIRDRFDSLQIFINERDLLHLVDSIRMPVYQGLGWDDFLFPANGGILTRSRMAGRQIPIWSYFGSNGHGVPFDPFEIPRFVQTAVQWVDHWMKGFSLTGDSVQGVVYTDNRPGAPFHESPVWPPVPFSRYRLYITQTGLSPAPPDADLVNALSVTYDSSYSPTMGWDDEYGGPAFRAGFQHSTLRYLSDPFDGDVEITDIPSVHLNVRSPDADIQVHVRFFDVHVTAGGYQWDFMSRANCTLRGNVPGSAQIVHVDGRALSHIVPAGHRIGIEVTSLDMFDDNHAAIIPLFRSTSCELLSGTALPSYVELPVVGNPPTGIRADAAGLPTGVQLGQNYPNPFNPETTIPYRLPMESSVRLEVWNILGQRIAVLEEGIRTAGEHHVRWEASGPSGMYVCTLTATPVAGGRSAVAASRRMLFLK